MKLEKFKPIYAIIVGISIMLLWVMLFITGQIPELETELFNILLHIFSEILLATTLIVSGIELLRKSQNAEKIFLVAMGLLIYSVINAIGYYGELGNWAMVVMFVGICCVAFILVISSLRNQE